MLKYLTSRFFLAFFFCFLYIHTASADAWRIKVHNSAVVENDIVTLGDIAEPLGSISQSDWNTLKTIQLFAAPDVSGKAFQISKKKLQESLYYVLGESANYLLLPNSLAIQRNGVLLREKDIMLFIQKELHPYLANLDGRAELVDYRVPEYVFLATKGQRIELEKVKIVPGRLSLKFNVREMDNSIVKKFTSTVFLNLWKDVPVPIKPYNRGDVLSPDNLTFASKNLAYIKGEVWDGKGGPWQLSRIVSVGEPILTSDLSPLAMVRRGQIVDIIYEKGSIRIRQQGEALQDGGPGDIINVRNTQSKKQVFGTVIDSGTVLMN